MDFLWIAAGLVLLLAGGEILVRGGVGLAQRLGVAPAVVGVTVLGFGTSTPELVTSLQAAAQGASGIAVGNVLGSNIANILLILGLAALIAPIDPRGAAPRRDQAALVIATVLAGAMILIGEVGRGLGLVLLFGLGLFLWVSVREARTGLADGPSPEIVPPPFWKGAALSVAGIALTILGAQFLVTASVNLARAYGISEAVIGLTLVAVGTSLPELATTIVAALRRQGQLALGNVLGSNVFNVLGILGVTAMVFPIAVPPEIAAVDLAALAGSALLVLGFIALGKIGRGAGAVMLALYAGYILWLAAGA